MQRYLPGMIFAVVVLGVAVALLLGMPALIALALVILALCGYSIVVLRQQLVFAEPAERPGMLRLHLRWLARIAVVGMVLGSIAIFLPARPGYAVLLMLALLAAVGMGQVVRGVIR